MAVVEIRCPNCGSPSATRNDNEYTCDNCKRKFQIVVTPIKENKRPNLVVPQIKFAKINFNVNQAKTLGNFVLEQQQSLSYLMLEVFKYHAYKRVVKGSKPVIASEYGYVFVSPFRGTIDTYINKTNKVPDINDFKQGIYQEFITVVSSNLFDDKPIGPMNIPMALPPTTVKNLAYSWITQNLSVKKTYIQPTAVQKRGGDLGVREITLKFNKNDFDEFYSIGIYGVPVFKLTYKLPNATKVFKRSVGGFSGQVLLDELKCFKIKALNRSCENFPDNACSSCFNLVCNEHEKRCEKCGISLCENCSVSKGMLSKHYYCKKCI